MKVILKPKREKSLLARHPWIFSGAIASLPSFEDGAILPVESASGQMLGYGYFNKRSQITGRMLSFETGDPLSALERHIDQAIQMRKQFIGNCTNAIRLINAEGDLLPGLIVDQYDDVLVVQVSTLGMDKLKGQIVSILQKKLTPSWIYEVSTSPSRKEEGLKECRGTLLGAPKEEIEVFEGALKFVVNPQKGQKTGFFQDLRDMRFLVQELSHNKRVLNCFSYTGAFSCHALQGGASFCHSVDISKEAIQQCTRHIQMNGFEQKRHKEEALDAFDFLRENPLEYDLIILDPPAFAKRASDVKQALRGYQEINRTTLSKMPKNSLLLTCSCSYHVDEPLFRKMLFHAATEAKREVRLLQTHRLAFDHPINIYHPEGSYLKSFLCYVN